MQNKPNAHNRDDIKVIITSIALTLTLAFWNLFSEGAQKTVQEAGLKSSRESAQVKILLGGPAPQTTIVRQSGGAQRRSSQGAPQPVANTGSSQ